MKWGSLGGDEQPPHTRHSSLDEENLEVIDPLAQPLIFQIKKLRSRDRM